MIYVGTVGEGVWRSDDHGKTWAREDGVPAEARIYSLAPAPDGGLYAGARGVVYHRGDGAWAALRLPDPELEVWALGVHPGPRSMLLAGCRPLALFAAETDGLRWLRLGLTLPPGTPAPHTPRVTAILFDPARPEKVWAGVEVGGVFEARDGGRTWLPMNGGLPSLDIHALARADEDVILAATPRGIAAYAAGEWSPTVSQARDQYYRALAASPGRAGTFYAGLGDGPPGTRGTVVVSIDHGRRWTATGLRGAASSIWSIATDPREPGLVVAGAIKGEVFVSRDDGTSWAKAPRAFGDIRAVACAP